VVKLNNNCKNMKFKFNKESGQVSRLILVLAIIVLVAVVIVFLVMRMAEKPPAPPPEKVEQAPQPVYEVTLGNIKFVFQSAPDKGNRLTPAQIINSRYATYRDENLVTTGKFIQVTIGAQNKGTKNIEQNAWEIENIIDSEGREFEPMEGYTVQPWLPESNPCGALLKPAFDPTPCTKIYEVAKVSTGLKVRVRTGIGNLPNNLSSNKVEEALIDLIVK